MTEAWLNKFGRERTVTRSQKCIFSNESIRSFNEVESESE